MTGRPRERSRQDSGYVRAGGMTAEDGLDTGSRIQAAGKGSSLDDRMTDKGSEQRDRVILIGVRTPQSEVDEQDSLDELASLADTAGAEVLGTVIQNLENPEPGTYIGRGKMEEVKALAQELDANGVIADDELSPAQMRNLSDALDLKVMDRTLLILDIFAQRATSSEGKIQVEMAQLKYRMTRLSGIGTQLSRLGGGIGTRGPGEKKLETDRRLIQRRITQLRRELEDVRRHRELLRGHRGEGAAPVAAIVGYTNAGKSTLLNTLTGAGVLAENKLFATLDPVTRLLELDGGQKVLLTDTVGFIRKLPHHLVEAFGSTLEEAKYADVIIHVVDASNPQAESQMETVYDTLGQLGVMGRPVITLLNKTDCLDDGMTGNVTGDRRADAVVRISAKTGAGLDAFERVLQDILTRDLILVERTYGYQDGGKVQLIRTYGQILESKYEPDGIWVKAYVPKKIYGSI